MKVHARWKERGRGRSWTSMRTVECCFLILGLAAIDAYIWVSTVTLYHQIHDDWAFNEMLREAPKPAVPEPPSVPSSVIGRLEIPSLDLAVMVREGADAKTLRKAVGHIPGTALPGRPGNVGLAGHRDTFFRVLSKVRAADGIEIETMTGNFRYVVESTRIVAPHDVSVLAPTTQQTLTLVTCYPFYYVGSAPKRFIVRAVLASGSLDARRRNGNQSNTNIANASASPEKMYQGQGPRRSSAEALAGLVRR